MWHVSTSGRAVLAGEGWKGVEHVNMAEASAEHLLKRGCFRLVRWQVRQGVAMGCLSMQLAIYAYTPVYISLAPVHICVLPAIHIWISALVGCSCARARQGEGKLTRPPCDDDPCASPTTNCVVSDEDVCCTWPWLRFSLLVGFCPLSVFHIFAVALTRVAVFSHAWCNGSLTSCV